MADPVYNPNLTIPISGSVAPHQTGPQTIIVTYPKRSSRREGYRSKASQICGILLIISGVGAIITQCVGFAIQMKKYNLDYPSYRFIGEGYFGWTGVWTSLFAFLAGSFAIVSSKTKRVGFIITTLVMSILSAVFVVFVIGMSSWIIADEGNHLKSLKYDFEDDWWDYWSRTDYSDMSYMIKGSIATAFFMLLCGIIEFLCSVFLSTLCCKVLCCSNVFLAASFAIISSKTKRVGFIITTLVYSILSAVFVIPVIISSSWAVTQEDHNVKALDSHVSSNTSINSGNGTSHGNQRLSDVDAYRYSLQTGIATGVFLLLFGLTEFLGSIHISALCCRATCCKRRQTAQTNNSQVLFLPSGLNQAIAQPVQFTGGQRFMGFNGQQTVLQAVGGTDIHPLTLTQKYTNLTLEKVHTILRRCLWLTKLRLNIYPGLLELFAFQIQIVSEKCYIT